MVWGDLAFFAAVADSGRECDAEFAAEVLLEVAEAVEQCGVFHLRVPERESALGEDGDDLLVIFLANPALKGCVGGIEGDAGGYGVAVADAEA